MINEIMHLKKRYENNSKKFSDKISKKEFTLLLSGISSCRKVPGIDTHMGYEELYKCNTKEDVELVRKHLKRLYGITDKATLIERCNSMFSNCEQYEQFMTFYVGAPLFDVNKLNPDGRKWFEKCKDLAAQFYPIVKEKGFYAWDINERIGLCRVAVAAEYITEEEFYEITNEWVNTVLVFYNSYVEYAVSCVCGAVYDFGREEDDVSGFFRINMNVIENLLDEGGAWERNPWYIPEEREWADLAPNAGCFITKKALEENFVGYMYRDVPAENYPDSGWRFFYGDESDEYANDTNNITVCGMNTICTCFLI